MPQVRRPRHREGWWLTEASHCVLSLGSPFQTLLTGNQTCAYILYQLLLTPLCSSAVPQLQVPYDRVTHGHLLSSRPCMIELPTAISSALGPVRSSYPWSSFSFLLTPIPTSSKAVTTSNVFLLEHQVNYLPLSLIVNSFQLLFLSIIHTISLVFLAPQEQ